MVLGVGTFEQPVLVGHVAELGIPGVGNTSVAVNVALEKRLAQHGNQLSVGHLAVGHELAVAHAGYPALLSCLFHEGVGPVALGHIGKSGGYILVVGGERLNQDAQHHNHYQHEADNLESRVVFLSFHNRFPPLII